MHEWRQQLHCGQGFKWTQMNWNIQHLVVNSHKKWAPAALLPQKCLPNRWIEKKPLPWSWFILYTSPYLNLHYIIYTCNCCLRSDNLHYPSNNHRSVKWTCYIYIIRVLVFGGFGSQGGAYWNRWYRYPSRSRPFHPESQYVASTRRGLAATSPQHTSQTRQAPLTCIYGSKMLGVMKCDYLRLDMFKLDSLMSIGAYISETHLHSDTKNKSSNDIKSHEATMNQTFSDNPLIHRLCVLIL